jgi:hypothetical protein
MTRNIMSREWYFAYGRIIDESGAPLVFPDAHPDSGDYILVLNPNDAPAHLSVTFFFEDAAPVRGELTVGARRASSNPLHVVFKDQLPWNTTYGCRVASDIPIVCQRTQGQWRPNDPVTEAMGSTMLYPGPLGDRETAWAYADGIICLREDHPLVESEWVSVLNPTDTPARVAFTAYHASERDPSSWSVTVGPSSIYVAKLDDQPWVVPYELFGLTVTSDRPVVVEQIRKAYAKGDEDCPRSMFDVIPVSGLRFEGE